MSKQTIPVNVTARKDMSHTGATEFNDWVTYGFESTKQTEHEARRQALEYFLRNGFQVKETYVEHAA